MNKRHEPCICGANPEPWFDIVQPGDVLAPTVMMLRCPACGTLRPDPIPESEGVYDVYYTQAASRGGWRRVARFLANQTRRAYLDRAVPASAHRILDYGCGAGAYLDRAGRIGRTCFGTDLLRPSLKGQTWTWLDIADIERAAPFDWITLGHVLEHLPDPLCVLRRLVKTLSVGGAIWIATPNAKSFLFAEAGARARDVDYPRHINLYSDPGLRLLLARAGLSGANRSPPRLNAILNTFATARIIIADVTVLRGVRLRRLMKVVARLALHLVSPRARRDHESPECIVVCRVSRPTRPPVL